MIRKYMLASLVVLGITASCAAEALTFARLDDAAIQKQAQLVADELQRNAWLKYMTYAAGAGTAAYLAHNMYFKKPASVDAPVATDTTATPGTATVAKVSHEVTLEKMTQSIEKIDALKDLMERISDKLPNPETKTSSGVLGTLKSWGSTTFNFVVRESAVAVVFSVVMGAFGKYFKAFDAGIDTVIGKVFHASNLKWFMSKHSNVYSVLNDLEWQAQCIENKRLPNKQSEAEQAQETPVALTEDQIAYHTQVFVTTWSKSVKEFESILGFMNHKKQLAVSNELLAQRYTQIYNHLYELINNFSAKAQELLAHGGVGLIEAVNRLRAIFMEERSAFVSCEKNYS